jgi:hypothetical protein
LSANKTNRLSAGKLRPKEQKILIYDIERFPYEAWSWGPKWETSLIEITQPAIVCSIAWQWYPRREKFVLALPDFPGYNPDVRDDSKLIRAFAKELNKCDVAIGHNVKEFDDKVVRTEAAKAGMKPLKPHRTFDTLIETRSLFNLPSYKLGDVCEEFGIGKKVAHPGFPLWRACMRGDPKAWLLMKKYNLGDVDPLARGLFEFLGPWSQNHPNMNVHDGNEGCPRCRSKNLAPEGHAYTQTTVSVRFRCRDCGKWSQGRVRKRQGVLSWAIR